MTFEGIEELVPVSRKMMPHALKCRNTRLLNKLISISGVNSELMGKIDFEGSQLDTPLLTKRVKSLLKEMKITTIEQLANLSYRVFQNRYGMGKGSLENVIAFLKAFGKELKEMPENYE